MRAKARRGDVEHTTSPGKRVTISMGVAAMVPDGGATAGQLLQAADQSL